MVATRAGDEHIARNMAGGIQAQPADIEAITEKYALDQSYPVQFVAWLKNLATLDLGFSKNSNTAVSELIKQRAPITLMLGFYSIIVALLISVPLAVLSAYRRDGWADKAGSAVSFGFVSMPDIVLGVLLGFLFATRLGWFPFDSDKVWPWDNPVEHFKNMALPVFTLAMGLAAVFTRLLRADMINTLQSDFIMLARAKGLSPSRILWRHALR